MPFIQAVFCLKGLDDRSRFFVTSLVSLVGFILLSAIFSDYTALIFICLLLLSFVLFYTTKRRLQDAKLTKNWQFVPSLLLLLTGSISLFIESNSSLYLLVLPALSIALLLTYPSKSNKLKSQYILGYCGPVDLSSYQEESTTNKVHNHRIEPTLTANGDSEQLYMNEPITESTFTTTSNNEATTHVDIGELIRLKFLSNRKFQLAMIVSVSLLLIVVLVTSLFTHLNQKDDEAIVNNGGIKPTLVKDLSLEILSNKKYLLVMPDNFTLFQSEYKGVIVHWQADEVPNGKLWSLSTASGDKSCQLINFNKGEPLRPLSVYVENGSDYFASFSPLDSKELIQALAARGKFSLCGYNFSLKGSQAILGKHAQYAPFLD